MTSQPRGYRKILGRRGEETAERFLRDIGYQILQRNFQVREGEIDLIAKADNMLVFVEVKTGRSDAFGHPADRVDENKQRRMIRAAAAYLQQQEREDTDCRFDVIAVRIVKGGPVVEHIKDAFQVEQDDPECS